MTINFHFLHYSLLEHDGLISCRHSVTFYMNSSDYNRIPLV